MGNVRSRRDIEASLCKKGFLRNDDSAHIQFFLKDVPRIRTMMSHGAKGKTVSAQLMGEMARQLNLTKKQFLALIDCTLDEEGLRIILGSEG
jgi:hypothetical protein